MSSRFAPDPRPTRLCAGRRRPAPRPRRGVLARAAGPTLLLAPVVAVALLWDPCLREGMTVVALLVAVRLLAP